MVCCSIYLLKNLLNNKIYIGQTWATLEFRWNNGHGYAGSKYLHSAIKKHGKENFKYEILALVSNQQLADYLEDYYIKEYDSMNYKIGYNLKEGGSTGKHSIKTRQFLSKIRRGTKLGNENTFYGKSHTPETKMRISKTKKYFSDEIESQIIKEYTDNIVSMQQVASKYDVSVKVIFNILHRGKNDKLYKGRGYQHCPRTGRFQSTKK